MPVPVPDGYDLTDPDIYAERVPFEEFAWLRKSAPIFWNAQTEEDSSFDDGGLWVVSRHADVKDDLVCPHRLVERGEHGGRALRRQDRRLPGA